MEKGNTTTPFSSIKTQNELDEELSKFREEHFKNTANNNEEKRDKSREDKEDQIGNLYSEPNQETKNIDDVDDDLAFDEVDEDSDTVDSAEPEKDVEKERIARINSFRKEFGDDIVQGFTNFDVIDSQKTSTIKVPDIDIFHRKIENQYESY